MENQLLTLKNNELTVQINPKGAELTHVIDAENKFDFIWNGSEWPKHAPILFPAIGRSTDDEYLLDQKSYPMQQHGFASDYSFEIIEQKDDQLSLLFKDNEETYQSYPFHFEFKVTYQLVSKKLKIQFDIKNLSVKSLTFALGFHPAFNLSGTFEDYQLAFETQDTSLKQFEIVKNPFPYRSGKIKELTKSVSNFQLERKFFEKGLVIFDNKIEQVKLFSQSSDYQLTMKMADFPYLCLWTKEDENLSYLCIEPFQGLPDIVNRKQELLQKEGNISLKANESKTYEVELNFNRK
ncbi:aldose 1-epimerase family protein [Lactococcus cremoris]|uniref:aldose 1-epimerase family protein n=1 Tax=Lactococcus lactis subsp. cremoris TaxID=1359 RepID=UPI000629FC63|nr:aldose 1-epimerase family protein [Lactococcus cremoris]KKW73670.1 aldose 1-epimerase family protein [Lactococcus cremoris]RDG22476.1 aldose 1-epimerase family protein [Lactococcus cremoris]